MRNIFLLALMISIVSLSSAKSLSIPNSYQKFSKTIVKFYDICDSSKLEIKKKSEIIWEKKLSTSFNELIVSWNALRPVKGHLMILVSLQHNGMWSKWHRLAQWGTRSQRTFLNKLNRYVHTKHCRVDMQNGSLASGFRIKVEFLNGASQNNLKALFSCVSSLHKVRLIYPKIKLPSLVIKDVPRQSQMLLDHSRYRDLCSPVSTSMVVAYLTKKLYGIQSKFMHDIVIDFAKKSYDEGDIDIYGNWILNVAEAFNACKGDVFFRVERLNSFYDLYSYLEKKIPIAVSVRRLRGGATPYAHGHFLVVVGWDNVKKCVLCLDPAFKKSLLRAYPLRSFLCAWLRSNNLAYVPMPIEPLM